MTHSPLFLFWIAVFSLTCVGGRALAQTPSASAAISRDRAFIGDNLVFQITVRDGEPTSPPVVTFPEDLEVTYAGVSTEMSTIVRNGVPKRTVGRVYQYRAAVLNPGWITIPAADVTLKTGEILRTRPVTLEARLPELAPDFLLEIAADRSTVFVGESIQATVTWTLPERVASISLQGLNPPAGVTIEPVDPPPGGERIDLTLSGQSLVGSVDSVIANREQMFRLRFRVLATPTVEGDFVLGPMRVVFDRNSPLQGRVRSYVESEPLRLQTKALPTEGRPADFNGLIGSFDISATASHEAVSVGDPITLTMEVGATQRVPVSLRPPDLSSIDGFAERFRADSQGWRELPARNQNSRRFSTVIRALSAEITEIPPVGLSAFDPISESYTRFESEPLPLAVRAVRIATLGDAIVSPGAGSRGTTSSPLEARPDLLWAPSPAAEMLGSPPPDASAVLSRPFTIVAIASGPTAWIASMIFVGFRARRSNPEAVQRAQLARAKSLARKGRLRAAACLACHAGTGCETHSVTEADVDRLPLSLDHRRTLRRCLGTESPPQAHEAIAALTSLRGAFGARSTRGVS